MSDDIELIERAIAIIDGTEPARLRALLARTPIHVHFQEDPAALRDALASGAGSAIARRIAARKIIAAAAEEAAYDGWAATVPAAGAEALVAAIGAYASWGPSNPAASVADALEAGWRAGGAAHAAGDWQQQWAAFVGAFAAARLSQEAAALEAPARPVSFTERWCDD